MPQLDENAGALASVMRQMTPVREYDVIFIEREK